MIQLLWKMVWRFLKIAEIKPPYDTAIPLLGIYTEETKAYTLRKPKLKKIYISHCSLQLYLQ